MFLSNLAQGTCREPLRSSFARALPLEDAIASESSSELEGAKTATAEKFWHEAAPSKHNLALDKRKRRANKKGGGGPAGPGLATTVPRSLSVSVSSRRPPWSVVPVIIWSGRWAGAVVGLSVCLRANKAAAVDGALGDGTRLSHASLALIQMCAPITHSFPSDPTSAPFGIETGFDRWSLLFG